LPPWRKKLPEPLSFVAETDGFLPFQLGAIFENLVPVRLRTRGTEHCIDLRVSPPQGYFGLEATMLEESLDAPVRLMEQDGRQELTLQGTVDIFWAEKLHLAAVSLAERGQDARVNCEKATHLTSAAFQILLALKIRVEQNSGHFSLGTVPQPILQQLDLAGLTELLLGETLKTEMNT
jgi:anti-anti-sigma factor